MYTPPVINALLGVTSSEFCNANYFTQN